MNLRKRFSGQYTLICMFAAFIIFTLIVGIIVQLQNIRSYNNNEELENLARNKLGMIKQNEIIYLEK